jgi:hypothetical protein
VCGRTLAYSGSRGHFHSVQDEPADHLPVPVPYEELGEQFRGRCDFCNDELPEFVLPVRDFILDIDRGQGSTADWAACRECATMLERDDWNGVRRRSMAKWQDKHGDYGAPDRERLINRLYRQVRKNITGAIKPL